VRLAGTNSVLIYAKGSWSIDIQRRVEKARMIEQIEEIR
jgi:hypothetical protein